MPNTSIIGGLKKVYKLIVSTTTVVFTFYKIRSEILQKYYKSLFPIPLSRIHAAWQYAFVLRLSAARGRSPIP